MAPDRQCFPGDLQLRAKIKKKSRRKCRMSASFPNHAMVGVKSCWKKARRVIGDRSLHRPIRSALSLHRTWLIVSGTNRHSPHAELEQDGLCHVVPARGGTFPSYTKRQKKRSQMRDPLDFRDIIFFLLLSIYIFFNCKSFDSWATENGATPSKTIAVLVKQFKGR